MSAKIRYWEGYKYVLTESYTLRTPITPTIDINTQFLSLRRDGTLTIRAGYAWDGPSGPAIDTRNFMRGSLVHDAFYQLMREGWLFPKKWRGPADELLREICREDGMSAVRAWWVYTAVKTFARRAASPEGAEPVLTAP